jgi:hypothetical protein
MAELYGVGGRTVGDLTSAYLRARDADPKSSYGDFAAVSHPVKDELAELLMGVVCDGIVAPGYAPSAVRRLSQKRKGRFLVIEADAVFTPPRLESREVYGLCLSQERDQTPLTADLLKGCAAQSGWGTSPTLPSPHMDSCLSATTWITLAAMAALHTGGSGRHDLRRHVRADTRSPQRRAGPLGLMARSSRRVARDGLGERRCGRESSA